MAETDRTRSFARVIGPTLVLLTSIIQLRMNDMPKIVDSLFANDALVWIAGALLVFVGVLIIANHQIWSSISSALVSVLGWLLLARGVTLLTLPQLYLSATHHGLHNQLVVRAGFGCLTLGGAWLTFTGWRGNKNAAR